MSKLFALEGSDKDLLIDKLLEREEEKTSPLSLTADLLKRREDISEEIEEKFKEDDSEEDDSEESESEEEGSEESNSEDKEDEEEEEEDSKEEDSKEEDSKEEDSKEEDEGSEADSEEDLDSLIGSANSDESKEESKDKKETSTESFRIRPTLKNCFNPLRESYSKYLTSLESFGIALEASAETEQPVVYVKESVLESINRLTSIANSSITSNNSFSKKIGESLLGLNERLAVFQTLVEVGKFHFTHKLVDDRDILSNISYEGVSSLRETIKAISNYLDSSTTASSVLLNNDFDQLTDSFLSNGFTEDNGELTYSKPIPGFTQVKVGYAPYTNYLKTKIEDFQFYKLKMMKTEDIFNIPSISITEDKDLGYIVEGLTKLITSLSISIDTLNSTTSNFSTFIDELKVIAYNVENDEFKNLSDLGLDNKVKDFIRFKLIMESSYININLVFDYITSVISVLNIVLELKD